jgi:prephenate dehydrogenase
MQLADALGARPIWMDADTHDHWVSAVSHLPYLAASALAATVPLEVAGLAGPGYRGTTRLASSPLTMMLDILSTNRENILADLRKYHLQLARIESLLELNDLAGLQAELSRASRLRGQILEKQKDRTGL